MMPRTIDAVRTTGRTSHAFLGGSKTGGLADRYQWLLGSACVLLTTVFPAAARATPVLYTTNGHYYEAVSQPQGITWDAANAAANARTFNNLPGHLATIASPNENAFVASHFAPALKHGYWLGGFRLHGLLDPASGWQWVTGEPFGFINWSVIGDDEPDNDWGPGTSDQDENKLQFDYTSADGTWKDARDFDTNALGYVVEYEPAPSANPPTITEYTTADSSGAALVSDPPGASILITGTNLGTSGTVLFDGIPLTAAALHWSPTGILAAVPTAPSYPFPTHVAVVVDRQQASGGAFTITAPTPGQDNLLANGSFEYPDSTGGPVAGYTYGLPLASPPYFHGYNIPGWRIPFGTIDVVRAAWVPAPGQGQQSIDLVGSPDAAIIAQSFYTELGRKYIFSGWVAHNHNIPEARADVFLNDQFFVQLHHQGSATPTQMGWIPFSYQFQATAEQTTLAIEDVTGINYWEGTALDGLSITPAPGG